jgi:hypothetical protein
MQVCKLVGFMVIAAAFACSGTDTDGSRDAGTSPDAGLDAGADAGGGGDSQEDYTYPGCASSDLGCPRLPTLYCALETIINRHSACAQDADCEFANFEGKCSGFPRCPAPAVNNQTLAQFEAEFQAEVDRYCPADGGCVASEGSCPYPPSAFRPACVSGKCRAELLDGGM